MSEPKECGTFAEALNEVRNAQFVDRPKLRLSLTPEAFDNKQDYWFARAVQLANEAAAYGVIVTIERGSREPFAMGNHVPVVSVWEKR